jgi:membrane-bound metal-dependent hydrolase YbcI (DUF457 family)
MPYTPFHWGPSSWVGLLFFGYLNFLALLIASVIPDIEPFCVIIFGLNVPLHGWSHSFFGGTIIALVLSGFFYRYLKFINRIMAWTQLDQRSSCKKVLASCLVGVYSHVLLDSFLYTDIKPLLPLSTNPFYGLVSSSAMYLFCSASFLVGGFLYLLKLRSMRALIVLVIVFAILAVSILVVPVILFAEVFL